MHIGSYGVISALFCVAFAGCAATPSDIDEAQAVQSVTSTSAFALTISGEEEPIKITTTNVSDTCPADSQCQFGFIGGSTLTIKPTFTRNTVDCLQFAGWTGACAGQGSTCTVVINSDITVGENFWTRILGCVPK
jgi:hypothetical protein